MCNSLAFLWTKCVECFDCWGLVIYLLFVCFPYEFSAIFWGINGVRWFVVYDVGEFHVFLSLLRCSNLWDFLSTYLSPNISDGTVGLIYIHWKKMRHCWAQFCKENLYLRAFNFMWKFASNFLKERLVYRNSSCHWNALWELDVHELSFQSDLSLNHCSLIRWYRVSYLTFWASVSTSEVWEVSTALSGVLWKIIQVHPASGPALILLSVGGLTFSLHIPMLFVMSHHCTG